MKAEKTVKVRVPTHKRLVALRLKLEGERLFSMDKVITYLLDFQAKFGGGSTYGNAETDAGC